MIWRQQIVDFLALFAAPSYSRIFDLDIPKALINRFYQVYAFTTVKHPHKQLADFLVISTQTEDNICIFNVMGLNLAGLQVILFTAICANKNYTAICTAINFFKDLGFRQPRSVLCDDMQVKLALD